MNKVDMTTPIGLFLGITLVALSIMIGGNAGLFVSLSSFLVTIGGSFAALMVTYRRDQLTGVFGAVRKTYSDGDESRRDIMDRLVALARKARKEGLLVLEDEVGQIENKFMARGFRLIVDAMDPEEISEILRADLDSMVSRHSIGQKVLKSWGAYAPAFGMIGTLIGLIQMLAQLDDPASLGPAMSLALITTFYGAFVANLVFIPLAGKLAILSDYEAETREMILLGILSIQKGTNPRVLEEKLKSFLPEEELDVEGSEAGLEGGRADAA